MTPSPSDLPESTRSPPEPRDDEHGHGATALPRHDNLFAPRRPARWLDPWRRLRPIAALLRQFDGRETPRRRRFDIVFGGVTPMLLVLIERCMNPAMGGLLGDANGLVPFRPYPGLLAGLGALVIAVSFARNDALRRVVAGAALFTALAAGAISLLLLPLALIGILYKGLGLLGLLPSLGAFAQLRVGLRLARADAAGRGRARARMLVVAGFLVAMCGTLAAGRGAKMIAHHDTDLLAGERPSDRDAADDAASRLRVLWHWPGVSLQRLNDLAVEQMNADDLGDDAPLARRWREITGTDGPYEQW